jgi:hypothetical protein
VAALRANVEGVYVDEAAVELLIAHGCWLERRDFVEAFVEVGYGFLHGAPAAWVDWPAAVAALDAGRLAGAGSEAAVLRVAASIAEGVPVDLGGALVGLDERNAGLVAAAVLHAAGGRGAAAVAGW